MSSPNSDRPACSARNLRASASLSLPFGTPRSFSTVVFTRSRARSKAIAMSSTPPGGSRSPTYGSSASLRSSPTSRSLSIISGSTSMRSAVPANHRILAPLMLEPKLLVAMSSSWWASSMTTMSCSGSIPCSARISVASRWVFTTMTSTAFARSLAISAKQLSPLGHLLRPGHSLLVTLTALQLAGLGSKSSSARSPVEDVSLNSTSFSTSSSLCALVPASESCASFENSFTRCRHT